MQECLLLSLLAQPRRAYWKIPCNAQLDAMLRWSALCSCRALCWTDWFQMLWISNLVIARHWNNSANVLCLIFSWLYRTCWDRINIAKHLCAGDGFSNKYNPGIRRHNSHWLQSVLHWIILRMSLILSLFLMMSPLARALNNTSTELAAPILSMLSTDKESKQEAKEKYSVCFTGLQIHTD